MTIASAESLPYRLPLRQQWQSSQGRLGERIGWIIVLRSDGLTGYGDCAPLPGTGTETLEEAGTWLERQLPRVRGVAPETALESLPSTAYCPPAARCGLETALLDLCARMANRSLSHWLDPRAQGKVRANASIGALDAHTATRVDGALGQGFGVLKIKVGFGQVDAELRALKELATNLPPGVSLRLDANRAWSFPQAERFVRGLQGLHIEALEEPLAKPDLNLWECLQMLAPFPLAVDESLGLFQLEEWAGRAGAQRILIKPMVVGGLRPALSLAKTVRQLGMQSLVTTTVDSAVGVWAAVHLAAALPEETGAVHGLATSQWLARDIADPPKIKGGVIEIASAGGLGLDGVGQSLSQ